jgi:hypothetical protein
MVTDLPICIPDGATNFFAELEGGGIVEVTHDAVHVQRLKDGWAWTTVRDAEGRWRRVRRYWGEVLRP